jgi:hypothetical protein
VTAFSHGLRKAGYAEGAIEFRWANDQPEAVDELARDRGGRSRHMPQRPQLRQFRSYLRSATIQSCMGFSQVGPTGR